MTSPPNNDWHQQPVNPDPKNDLGYDIVPLDVVEVEHGDADHRVLLPTDEAMLKRDAYMIVPAWMLHSIHEYR